MNYGEQIFIFAVVNPRKIAVNFNRSPLKWFAAIARKIIFTQRGAITGIQEYPQRLYQITLPRAVFAQQDDFFAQSNINLFQIQYLR